MFTRCLMILLPAAIFTTAFFAPPRASEKKDVEPAKAKKEAFKPIDIESEITKVDVKDPKTQEYTKTFTLKMEKDVTYQIDLTSTFQSHIRLETTDGKETVLATGTGRPASLVYKASKTEEYQITVLSRTVGKFALSVRDPSASMIFTVKDKLDKDDKLYDKKHHKVFVVELEAGKGYQIDMKSKQVDSYLFLESPDGKVVAKDDDSGGERDARVNYKATVSGKYKIIATHFEKPFNGYDKFGEFTLTVRQTSGAPRIEKGKEEK